MDEPRYYVRHYSAYRSRGNDAMPSYDAYSTVRDRWYCCKDVAQFRTLRDKWGRGLESAGGMRRRADAECARLNAEHDAWLASEGMASR